MKLKEHIAAKDLLFMYLCKAKKIECYKEEWKGKLELVTYRDLYNTPGAEITGFEMVNAETRKRGFGDYKNPDDLLIIRFQAFVAPKETPAPRRIVNFSLCTQSALFGDHSYRNIADFIESTPAANPHLVDVLQEYAEQGEVYPFFAVKYSNDTFEIVPFEEFIHSDYFLSRSWSEICWNINEDMRADIAKERDGRVTGINAVDVTLADVLGIETAIAGTCKAVKIDEPETPNDDDDFEVIDDGEDLGLSYGKQDEYYPKRQVNLRELKLTDFFETLNHARHAHYYQDDSVTIFNDADLLRLRDAIVNQDCITRENWVHVYNENLNINCLFLPDDYQHGNPDEITLI